MQKLTLFFALIFIGASSSCSDIFEEDIENRRIDLLAPADDDTLTDLDVSFLWREDDDINLFRFQLYESNDDYSQFQKLVADTLMVENQYFASLDTGNYLWRVRGENSEINRTVYTNYNQLYVSNTSDIDISDQTVFLVSPTGQKGTMNTDVISITFQWTQITGAEGYIFSLSNDITFTDAFVLDSTISGQASTNITISDIPSATKNWYWRVYAYNNSYQSNTGFQDFATDTTIAP